MNTKLLNKLAAVPTAIVLSVVLSSCGGSAPESSTTSEAPPSPAAQNVSAPAGAESTGKVAIGKPAADFTLTDTNGKPHTLSKLKGKYIVLEWYNPDCPFVKKHYESGNMQNVQKNATKDGTLWFSVVSSAPGKQGNYPAAKFNAMAKANKAVATATLLDPIGKVGKQYDAKTTPHMFVIDPKGNVIYNGAIDDKPSADPASLAGAKNYVLAALIEAKSGKKVTTPTTQPYGCSVKY